MKQSATKCPTQLTRDEVAALDIATHTGFYCTKERGTWDFTESMRRNNNKQHAAFRNTLIDFITRNGIKQIVAEDVSVNNHFTDTRKLSEFRGILFEVCDTLDLPEPAFINPMTVKKFATGDGHAKKYKMMEFCRKRWQIEPGDDNEADAIHIFFCYIKRFKL
jgi:Holliday junction resolvasome RuvABC endonuclease subunit|nr:MAG TPA: RuvC [Caudoviricetes sp.]